MKLKRLMGIALTTIALSGCQGVPIPATMSQTAEKTTLISVHPTTFKEESELIDSVTYKLTINEDISADDDLSYIQNVLNSNTTENPLTNPNIKHYPVEAIYRNKNNHVIGVESFESLYRAVYANRLGGRAYYQQTKG